MTISTSSSSILVAGNSSMTSFAFPFIGAAVADISVSTLIAGVLTSLPATAYSVTLNPAATNQLWGVGGQVLYPLMGSPLATGAYLLIQRTVPYTQSISVQNQGNVYPRVTEQALDLLEMQIQQLAARTTQFRGIWLTGTQYYYGDIVQDGPHGNNTLNYYICTNANISGVWSTDLAAGDWNISALAAVPTGNLTLTGDVTGTGSSPITTTLASVNSDVGSFTNASITVDSKGRITAASSGSSSAGTVTSVTYTGDGVLQSSTPSTAVTNSGTLTATLIPQSRNTILAGPSSGSNANPTFRALVAADVPSPLQLGTPTATTSGTSVTYTIPTTAKEITVNFKGFKTSGSSIPIIQIGPSGGVETTGYTGIVSAIADGSVGNVSWVGSGIPLNQISSSSYIYRGSITLSLLDATNFIWAIDGGLAVEVYGVTTQTTGEKTLAGSLNKLTIKATNGTDTFTAGVVNVAYQ